jgi:hypothetical protein
LISTVRFFDEEKAVGLHRTQTTNGELHTPVVLVDSTL